MAMAIVNWVVWQDGHDDNGGGFKASGSGTDRSLSATPYVTLDGSTIKATSSGATANMTITGYTAVAADVGNIVHITGGTNATTGWYEIQSISGSDWVVDRNWCTGAVTDGAGRMGGALASVGGLGALLNSNSAVRIVGSRGWVKYSSTAYVLGTATYNLAGGPFSVDGSWNYPFALHGYETTFGDTPTTRPRIDNTGYNPANGIIYQPETTDDYPSYVAHLHAKLSSGSLTYGFSGSGSSANCFNCVAEGAANGFSGGNFIACIATGCTVVGFLSGNLAYKCIATACADGFGTLVAVNCLAYENTDDGFYQYSNYPSVNCVSVRNGGDGFYLSSTIGSPVYNCVATHNTGKGFNLNTVANIVMNSYHYNNSGGNTVNQNLTSTVGVEGITALTADPWINSSAAEDDYWLNNIAGGGAVLRAAGIKLPLAGAVDEPDIAATQHADPGSVFTRRSTLIGR